MSELFVAILADFRVRCAETASLAAIDTYANGYVLRLDSETFDHINPLLMLAYHVYWLSLRQLYAIYHYVVTTFSTSSNSTSTHFFVAGATDFSHVEEQRS